MVPYSLLPAHSAQHRLKLVFKKDNVTSAFLYRLCRRLPALAQEKQHAHVLPWPVSIAGTLYFFKSNSDNSACGNSHQRERQCETIARPMNWESREQRSSLVAACHFQSLKFPDVCDQGRSLSWLLWLGCGGKPQLLSVESALWT